jgi:hypothetical protein
MVAPDQLALMNDATAPADTFTGVFTAPLGGGFTVVGNSLPNAIAPGGSYGGLYVSTQTGALGAHSETLTFTPTETNASGFTAVLPAITLTVKDEVAAPAAAALNTPGSIVFPNAHVGATDQQAVSVTNTAPAPAAALSVTGLTGGHAFLHGTVTGLAAGQTDAVSLTAGLDTTSAGLLSGVIDLLPSSVTSLGATALAGAPAIDLFGGVYRLASASVAPVNAVFQVGDAGAIALSVANTDAADGFSENLLASLSAVTGGFTAAGKASTGEIAAGASDTTSLGLTASTAKAGVFTGTATLSLISDGGTGAGSLDGLGQTGLTALAVPLSVTVDAAANPVFKAASGTLTHEGSAYTLDLGAFAMGDAQVSAGLSLVNDVAGPADSVSGTFALSGPAAFTLAGFGPVTALAAGASDAAPTIGFDPSAAGTFAETITFTPTESDGAGFTAALAPVTLTVTAEVMPCFLEGTRIATPGGPRAVEELRVGDLVATASGGARPVVWIGSRRVDCLRHPRPELVHPVRVRAGAFGTRLPSRDLLLSPDHAVFAEGVLIPIKHLVNGASVAVEPRDRVTYFHIELDRHDVVLAENLPTESYLDTGDRARFEGGRCVALYPDFSSRVWEAEGCAPLRLVGPEVDAVRDSLVRRAKRSRAKAARKRA